jgi:hypothetical protein
MGFSKSSLRAFNLGKFYSRKKPKNDKEKGLSQRIAKKQRRFIHPDDFLSEKVKPERHLLRKWWVSIKGNYPAQTEE